MAVGCAKGQATSRPSAQVGPVGVELDGYFAKCEPLAAGAESRREGRAFDAEPWARPAAECGSEPGAAWPGNADAQWPLENLGLDFPEKRNRWGRSSCDGGTCAR